jgi:hypothetical protein
MGTRMFEMNVVEQSACRDLQILTGTIVFLDPAILRLAEVPARRY